MRRDIPVYGAGDTPRIQHELEVSDGPVSLEEGDRVTMSVRHHRSGEELLATDSESDGGLEVLSRDPGRVAYQFGAGETTETGVYLFTFRVEHTDDRVYTSRPEDLIAIRIT